MNKTAANRSSLVSVSDSLGGRWLTGSKNYQSQAGLIAGSKFWLTVEASEGAMFGLAVGSENVATTEWNDAGCFEVLVTSSYVPALHLHIAVRHPTSKGTQSSKWLGPTDDLWIIGYGVQESDRKGERTDCP